MNAKEIKNILDSEQRMLNQVIEAFPTQDKRAYANWVAQTYYFVCHSTRLLALAASRFSREKNEQVHLRFLDHIQEERGHEKLALRDLENLGFSISDFPELQETKAFYQTQYYWIEHVNPCTFFGYVLALEACAVESGYQFYEKLRNAYGDKGTVFLKVHVKEDVDHVQTALKCLEALDEKEQLAVIENMKLSGFLYAQIYKKITATVKEQALKGQKAA